MKKYTGKIIYSYFENLIKLLYKKGYTIDPLSQDWELKSEYTQTLESSRYDVVHMLLFFASLNYYIPKNISCRSLYLPFTGFPYDKFINSFCFISNLSFRYNQNEMVNNLLQNSLMLMLRLSNKSEFKQSLENVNSNILLSAFYDSTTNFIPGFAALHKMASEYTIFLLLCCLNNSNFVKTIIKENLSNLFIYYLINSAQYTLEKVGTSYIHLIIIEILIKIISNSIASKKLNQPFNHGFNTKYKPENGSSFGDVILNVLFNICDKSDEFLPKACELIYFMMLSAEHILLESAKKIVKLYIGMIDETQKDLMCDIFANIVQKFNINNGFLIAIILQFKYFYTFKSSEKQSMKIINEFIHNVIAKSPRNQEIKLTVLMEIIKNLKIDEIFPKKIEIKHEFTFEFDDKFDEFNDYLYSNLFFEENDRLLSLKYEINPFLGISNKD